MAVRLQDGDTVTPVKGNSARSLLVIGPLIAARQMYLPDVENTRNSSVGSEADQVDSDAKEDRNPDCEERGSSQAVDASPNRRRGNQPITRKRKDSSS